MKSLEYLIICIVLMITQTTLAYDFEADGFYFNITNRSTNEVAVTYKTTSYNSYSGVINIPTSVVYNGTTYAVTSIDSYAFNGCTGLISVTIPNSVTSIGASAFLKCTNIRSLTIGSGVTTIGNYAFSTSTSSEVQYYTIPKVIWLGNTPPSGVSNVHARVNYVSNSEFSLSNKVVYPFLSSKFEVDGVIYIPVSPSDRTCDVVDCVYADEYPNLTISDKVTNRGVELTVLGINQYTFYGNQYIQSATISHKGDILSSAFYGCTGLKKVSILNQGSIGQNAFYNCSSLNDVELGDEVTAIGDYAFYGCSSIPALTIPNSVTTFGTNVFQNCKALESIELGTGLKSLPTYSFSGCSSLASLTLPSNITSIGNYAFKGCTSLGDVTFEDGSSTLTLGSNGSSPLFADCKLDDVYIGRKLSYQTSSSYGYSPFYRNTSLKTVEITDAETQIYDNEFYGCSNLQEFSCGDGVTSIGNWAFSGCSALKSYESGGAVKTIGNEAFSDCTAMTSFISHAAVPPTCGTQALDDINKWECTLYVPDESIDDYKGANQWKEFFFINGLSTGIDDVVADCSSEIDFNAPVVVYNLSGMVVYEGLLDTYTLRPGVYIVKQGIKAIKYAIR